MMKETVQETADRLFARHQHYYVYEEAKEGETTVRRPVGTVVVGIRKGSGRLCRGISICSTAQNFDRSEGLNRALARMNVAAIRRVNGEPLVVSRTRRMNGRRVAKSAEAVDRFVANFGMGSFFKSEYHAAPTPVEKRILAL